MATSTRPECYSTTADIAWRIGRIAHLNTALGGAAQFVANVYLWEKPMPKLCRWGNSLGIRVPVHIAERAALQIGDSVYLRLLDSGEILIRIAKARDIPDVFKPLATDGVPKESRPLTDQEVKDAW